MEMRENRTKSNPEEFAGDFRRFMQTCGITPAEDNADLEMSLD